MCICVRVGRARIGRQAVRRARVGRAVPRRRRAWAMLLRAAPLSPRSLSVVPPGRQPSACRRQGRVRAQRPPLGGPHSCTPQPLALARGASASTPAPRALGSPRPGRSPHHQTVSRGAAPPAGATPARAPGRGGPAPSQPPPGAFEFWSGGRKEGSRTCRRACAGLAQAHAHAHAHAHARVHVCRRARRAASRRPHCMCPWAHAHSRCTASRTLTNNGCSPGSPSSASLSGQGWGARTR